MAMALFMRKMGAKCADYADGRAGRECGTITEAGRLIVGIVTRAARYKWPLYIKRNCRRIVAIVGAVL
jgi:hypothetical protein